MKLMTGNIYGYYKNELRKLEEEGNIRILPHIQHEGKYITVGGSRMLNLSSNDYLGLSDERNLYNSFLNSVSERDRLLSASSSRLLTGNFHVYDELESLLASMFGKESALVFNSGYHMNTGILPAITDSSTLILADKLIHASLIDGIRLSGAKCIRYRHLDNKQLDRLVEQYHNSFERIIIVTESIFSMDGDIADLEHLTELKRQYPNVMLYVDEAHGIGVRGKNGLGLAEEQQCISDIDFLCGTFGKALCSVGAYLVCKKVIKEFLVNRMRTVIFTTALPPLNIAWTKFIVERLPDFYGLRKHLEHTSSELRDFFNREGFGSLSASHIIPMITGKSHDTILKAEDMQKKGVYVLPIRPPTVPEGTSRLRFSLTASLTEDDIRHIKDSI